MRSGHATAPTAAGDESHLFTTSKCRRLCQATLGSSGHSQATEKFWAMPKDSSVANDPNAWPRPPSQSSPVKPANGPSQGGEATRPHATDRDLAPSQGNFARLPWLRTFPVMSYVSIYKKLFGGSSLFVEKSQNMSKTPFI